MLSILSEAKTTRYRDVTIFGRFEVPGKLATRMIGSGEQHAEYLNLNKFILYSGYSKWGVG